MVVGATLSRAWTMAAVTLFAAVHLWTSTATACLCGGTALPLDDAPNIFEVIVTTSPRYSSEGVQLQVIVEVEVVRIWRGDAPTRIHVDVGTSCSIATPLPGTRWLLFDDYWGACAYRAIAGSTEYEAAISELSSDTASDLAPIETGEEPPPMHPVRDATEAPNGNAQGASHSMPSEEEPSHVTAPPSSPGCGRCTANSDGQSTSWLGPLIFASLLLLRRTHQRRTL